MVSIVGDELWNPEPALKPEDEIILRKLQDMLQSTAEDLKVLSGELSKYHEPGIQVRTLPTPLDDDFNDKVHIEEVVNAKFCGHKIVDNPNIKPSTIKSKVNDNKFNKSSMKRPVIKNTSVQVNTVPILKKPLKNKYLSVSKIRTLQIIDSNEQINNIKIADKINESKASQSVSYNEFCYKYESKPTDIPRQSLKVQKMPSINIRSELRQQNVLHFDIIPEHDDVKETQLKRNVSVLQIKHEIPATEFFQSIASKETKYHQPNRVSDKRIVRKVSKMSTYESSESTNNVNSDAQNKLKSQKKMKFETRTSPKTSSRNIVTGKKKAHTEPKNSRLKLDEWEKKLNTVYGHTSNTKKFGQRTKSIIKSKQNSRRKTNLSITSHTPLNNGEYIPYSQLTLGGMRVSDIEREVSDGVINNDLPLSPLLDKIGSSKDNSFNAESPRKNNNQKSPKILNTSDENLLQEVIDIEKKFIKTLAKNTVQTEQSKRSSSSDSSNTSTRNKESYDDDFEEAEKSGTSDKDGEQELQELPENFGDQQNNQASLHTENNEEEACADIKDTTYIKSSNLSIKDSVDIFEYVHSVNTQDNATQSQTSQIISLKETQTSPRNETSNIKPIHNDLWSSIDPKREVDSMFKLEKDLIKKLIIEEYGDILEKSINKPSTSKDCYEEYETVRNVVSSQKNTQTSPAHVKSVMTSPAYTKNRTTSPFTQNFTDHRTSPLNLFENTEDKLVQTELENSDAQEEPGISINLSSPRFSLRLPQTSREVLSNLDSCSHRPPASKSKSSRKVETSNANNKPINSSTSADAEASSSEVSSFGEVKLKLKRRMRKNRFVSISESSTTSTASKSSSDFQSGGILPLRSEGEISFGQGSRNRSNKNNKAEDKSLGQL